jgi:hypothetical protein
MRPLSTLGALSALLPLASAQVTNIATPGMPPGATLGMDQTDRFANDFNPGIGFVFDLVGGYYDFGHGGDESGFDFALRTFEMTPAGYIDPSTWGWATIVWNPDEGVALEEAALVYTGTPGRTSLRAGRFFIDFGKQMQAHIHDLRTVDRPLVLREYLGVETAGTGVQWDQWFPAGDRTTVRYSLGILPRLDGFGPTGHLHGGGHGDGHGHEGAEFSQQELKELNDFNLTARLTGFSEFGKGAHVLQYGGSARFVPSYTLSSDEAEVAAVDGLRNTVWGLDLTYGWQNDTGQRGFSTGIEWLWNMGDLGGEVEEQPDLSEVIEVFNGTATGFYGWGEYRWNQQRHAVGAQWSRAQTVSETRAWANEYDLYYSWNLTELNRIRFALTMLDPEDGERSFRAAIQLTAFLGPHAHGVNW